MFCCDACRKRYNRRLSVNGPQISANGPQISANRPEMSANRPVIVLKVIVSYQTNDTHTERDGWKLAHIREEITRIALTRLKKLLFYWDFEVLHSEITQE